MLKKVKVTGGFWLDRLNTNKTAVHAVYNRFKDSGRFEGQRIVTTTHV